MAVSAQDFIRALKASSDPPQTGGPTKLELAVSTWQDQSQLVPNKEENIVEWLLTRLLKEKDATSLSSPLLDLQVWKLLCDILEVSARSTNASRSSRPLRSWLLPLLNRLPIAPILIAFLGVAHHEQSAELLQTACKTLSLIWPIAIPKINIDALIDCFSSVTSLLAQPHWKQSDEAATEAILRLSNLVISSYRSSLASSATKKKLLAHFVQNIFQDWLQCISVVPTTQAFSNTLTEVYQAGIDTIFSIDTLRQAQGLPDEAIEDSLRKVADSHSNAVLAALPRMFLSYINISQKHRNTLFAQGSSRGTITSAEQVRKAGMKVFASFIQVIRGLSTTGDIWITIAALLNTVDSQRLLALDDEAAQDTLKIVGELACEVLTSHTIVSRSSEAAHALLAFATIVHIDYDLAAPVLPRVLRAVVTKSLPGDSSSMLLNYVLEYSTQTRSADALVDLLLSVCGPQTFTGLSSPYEALYVTAATGILNRHTFIDKFSKFLHAFVTPGQILKITQNAIEHLRTVSSEFSEASKLLDVNDASAPRKKRKTETGSQTASADPEPLAISLSMIASIVSVVLTSLPLHLLQNDGRQTVVDLIQELLDTTQGSLKSAAKRISRDDPSRSWTWQIVASGLLRLRYDLSSDRHLHLDTTGNTKVIEKLSPLLKVETLSPQLWIEILRSWLHNVESHRAEPTDVFDEVLTYLQKWLPGASLAWDGDLCDIPLIDEGRSQASIAILYTILDRWLPLFDTLSTEEQCRRLVTIITTALSRSSDPILASSTGISVHDVLHRVLHNAVFWESHRLRDALLAHISEQTAPIDELDVKLLLSTFNSKERANVSSTHPSLVSGTFSLLMSTPMEYLTKRARSDLLRRAQAADVAISQIADDSVVTMLREFQRRMYESSNSVDHPLIAEYSLALVNSFEQQETVSETLMSTTQELVRMHFSAAVKLSSANEQILFQIIDSFKGLLPFDLSASSSHGGYHRARSLSQLIDIITTECKPTTVSATVRGRLLSLREQLLPGLLNSMRNITSDEDLVGSSSILPALDLWHRFLVLSRWLSCTDEHPRFGITLVTHVLSAKCSKTDILVAVLSIVQEEVSVQITNSGSDRAEIIATYLAFARLCPGSDLSALDSSLACHCRSSSLAHFGVMLDFVYESISTPGSHHDYLAHLVHASDVMMRHAPEGSLKVLQTHLSRSLVVFADLIALDGGSDILGHVLAFLGNQFNDRPAMIRQQDLSSVWSILGSCFKGSTRHESATNKTVLNGTISVISALLRLRRDLVTTTLPHLSFILRRLIMTLRRLRPHLGGKQTRLVSDTLPSWMDASEPARAEDSKAIARLLTTLTTKTVVRTYGTSTSADGQKAQSLARPFSKHAAYVLCAYIEALNDPLCVIPAEVRKELEPGLFALCDMMGENNRDAMMVASLDAGGKSVMKGIWREYEKQKYVGKG